MFFLSFSPLWISVLFIDIKNIYEGNLNLWTEVISISLIVIFTIISMVVLLCELNPRNANNKQEYILVSAKDEKTITAEYLLSYILPLFAFDFTVWPFNFDTPCQVVGKCLLKGAFFTAPS